MAQSRPPVPGWQTALLAGLFVLTLVLSLHLRHKAVTETSPTFDEPYYLFQSVYFRQQKHWYEVDLNPPLFSWLIAQAAPKLGNFQDALAFSKKPESFQGRFSYRMDEFSGLPGDEAMVRTRWLFQFSWVLLAVSLLFIGAHLGVGRWGLLTLFAFVSLEPTLLGLSALVRNDVTVVAFLCAGTALSLARREWLHPLALLFFTFAWATKFTAALWAVPIGLGLLYGRIPRRTAVFWAAGIVGAVVISSLLDYPYFFAPKRDTGLRLSYLDRVVTTRAEFHYFVQALLCKLSLGALVATIYALWSGWIGANRKNALLIAAVVLASLVAPTIALPGLGIRLVLATVVTIFLLVSITIKTPRVALAIVAVLALESYINRDSLLAYQNPLAGREPRLADSNLDWGQGLKQLGEWRRANRDVPLALSVFGGTLPETYGITGYTRLPSFPELSGGAPLEGGRFSGYVAVSRNFLLGYVVDHPAIRMLRDRRPIRCFQGALCLFDVRDPS